MTITNSGEPDITLVLDSAGVINQAIAGNSVADEAVGDWVGLPWMDTVRDDERADIGRLVERTRLGGIAGIGHVAQRFPSGLVVPLEYTMVRLGDGAGIVAVGKQLRAVAQLQSRLLDTQRVLEQDYWKLRAVETRYRLLLDAAQDALVTLDSRTLRIVEINPPAAILLGLTPGDACGAREVELPSLLAENDRKTLRDVVRRARNGEPANGLLRHLKGAPSVAQPDRDLSAIGTRHRPALRAGPDGASSEPQGPWLVRASLIPAAPGDSLLQLQIAADASQPADEQVETAAGARRPDRALAGRLCRDRS